MSRRGIARVAPALLVAALLTAPARADAPAVARVDVGVVDAIARGPSLAERLEEIRRRIQEATVYPPIARRLGLTGVAFVRFEIAADGHATDLETARSSGHAVLDEAAHESVVQAGRLPRVHGRLEVPIRFALD